MSLADLKVVERIHWLILSPIGSQFNFSKTTIISKKNKAYFLMFISNLFVNKLYDLLLVNKIG